MRTILVPTDFSLSSENALFYALELVQAEKAKIVVLNAYPGNSGKNPEISEAEKNESLRQLQVSGTQIAKSGIANYELLSKEGAPVNTIINTAKEKKVHLIVIAARSENDFLKAILGSVSARVIERARCPVIAIPAGTSFKPIKKITFATNYNDSDLTALKTLVEMFRQSNAQITILHVADPDESPDTTKDALKKFMVEASEKLDYHNLCFQLLLNESVETQLQDYIESDAADLLVMSAHHRDFFERIFTYSLTSEVVHWCKIPLMVFHFNEKAAVKVF